MASFSGNNKTERAHFRVPRCCGGHALKPTGMSKDTHFQARKLKYCDYRRRFREALTALKGIKSRNRGRCMHENEECHNLLLRNEDDDLLNRKESWEENHLGRKPSGRKGICERPTRRYRKQVMSGNEREGNLCQIRHFTFCWLGEGTIRISAWDHLT